MRFFILACLLFVPAHITAIQVSPGSTCAAVCLDDPESDPLNPVASSTTVSDISCNDEDFNSTSKGTKFKNCLECLQESTSVSGGENDISWFLYNLRYSIDVCVYGFPNASKLVSSPCNIDNACGPLKSALETNGLNPGNGTEFDYCDADAGNFSGTQLDDCIQCFESSSSQVYMANFLTALKAGCQQRPEPGTLLGLGGSPFSTALVSIMDPPNNQTSTSDTNDTSPMTTGAIVGIAVGASLLFLGGTALFWIYYQRQKHLYGDDYDSHYDSRAGSKSISPPLVGGFNSTEMNNHSHLSDYELKAQQSYNNNAAYYDSIEKEIQARRPQYTFDPNNPGSGASGALPTHPAYINQNLSRKPPRDPSPQPPRPTKSNKPDSYALAAYLNAAEDALRLPGPPPGPPPAVHSRGPSPVPDHLNLGGHSLHGRNTSISSARSSSRMTALQPPPPPPPPGQPRVPPISLPSIPRIRIPKKYTPPKIHIEGATPVTEQSEDLPFGIQISKPVVEHDKRFIDHPSEAVNEQQMASRVVEHTVVDRRPKARMEELIIRTGQSSLYG